MSTNNLETPTVWIVSIHDMAQEGHLAFDTIDILNCLGPSIGNFLWAIAKYGFECTGEGADTLHRALDTSGEHGLVLTTDELAATFRKVRQTIDATIVGIPKKLHSSGDLQAISDIGRFPHSGAQLIIRAVDSSFFEIITKDHQHVESIKKCFKDVREENASNYFAALK